MASPKHRASQPVQFLLLSVRNKEVFPAKTHTAAYTVLDGCWMWMRTVVGWNVTLVLPPGTANKVLARPAELSPAVFQAVLETRVLCCCRRCAASQAGREVMEQGQGDSLGDKSVSEMLELRYMAVALRRWQSRGG